MRLLAAAALAALLCIPALGNHQLGVEWEIAQGGRLYDRWYDELMVAAPTVRHPLYPPQGPLAAAESWRCVNCHGWDYRGSTGGAGSLEHLRNMEESSIAQRILAPAHGYHGLLTDIAVRRLAAFLSGGQGDFSSLLDAATSAVRGDRVRGAWLFATVCANCHGMDGAALALPYGGTLAYVARTQPRRFLHKVRFGEPDTGMVALTLLSAQDQVDLLLFAQMLKD